MVKNNNALKWLYKYTKKQLIWVILLSVLSGGIALGFIGLALVSKNVLDIATGDVQGSMLAGVLGIAGIVILQAVLNIAYANIGVRAMGKINIRIKQGLFDEILKKKWKNISQYHTGEILNRFTSDVDIIVDGVIGIIPQAISLATRLFAGLIVLMAIDMKFTVAIIVLGGFVFFASKVYSKHFKYLHKRCQEADGVIRSFIQEGMENLVVIKSFANDNVVCKRLDERQQVAYKLKLKRNAVSNIANTGVYVLSTGSYYAALVWGALQISTGILTFGSLTAFLQIIEQIKAPMKNMSGLIPQYYSMIASVERIMEIENLPQESNEVRNESRDELYGMVNAICFDNVTFSYKDENVLEGASCRINKGELVAIAGPSGVGKSTLIKLLLGLIEAKDGKVYLDTAGEKINVDGGVRKLFTYVPQGNMILSGSIKENIGFCMESADETAVEEAAKVAMIWDFIKELPEGMDTIIGERGLGLSEGQIQRLAIARAILSDAPILLLDEATSALDEETERGLLNNLKKMKGKTCIFISHKATTIDKCDRVIYVRDKKLTEG